MPITTFISEAASQVQCALLSAGTDFFVGCQNFLLNFQIRSKMKRSVRDYRKTFRLEQIFSANVILFHHFGPTIARIFMAYEWHEGVKW